ncbi:ATP-binding cassette domain-containing protein [Prosthecomicrobium pneumaticum]|uniref:ABC-type glutathione transport system ATPase component n=1 Tax=Prosthecomicrobium pneumaticum TaxID=81895 RepID=A0A7W9FJJ4_9HYPH|nr:ABC transporter ATP-binding protein [Prosthecomicrobium pneumaticum]MBB5751555.1 ABC-type glutathione transport system ATPase component [Prosthecomicrobium pneumaticum]
MSASPEAPVIALEGLTVGFGGAPVLDGIDLELRPREIFGVVGETGAGKSVLARAILGQLPPGGRIEAGRILLEGRPIDALDAPQAARYRGGRVALIGTNAKALLDPVARVGDQIGRVLRAHGKPDGRTDRRSVRDRAVALMREVGINDPERRARAYPHELSGGMAQRIVIAMALAGEPEVLLADDATLGLDATVQAQVLERLVERSRERGLSVLLITHDLGIVRHYCDRLAVMRGGRLVEVSEVSRFMAHPADGYSRDLLAAARARPALQPPRKSDDRPPIVDVRDLTMHFQVPGSPQPIRAVDGISFSVAPGETLALVGESGSGKTTAGQCLLRLLDNTDGRIVFDGRDITDMKEAAFRPLRRHMQMVFQEPYVALNPRRRVRDLLAEPLALVEPMTGAERGRRVAELLAAVNLDAAVADIRPGELTAGEQKRVGIARALATKPRFVVFDEPTTALDIRVRAQIIDLIRGLQSSMNLAALFITHDLNSVRSLAHRVAVMHLGKILEQGETRAIFESPREDYTRKLLAAELPIDAETSEPASAGSAA